MNGDGIVWVNGKVTAYADARIALEDRGFTFGDGVYDVIRAYRSVPFGIDRHLARLARSAAGIELALPRPPGEIKELAVGMLGKSGIGDAEIYIQVTRGPARRSHVFPESQTPTLVVGVRPVRHVPPELWQTGCSVVTAPDQRWARCDLKTICLLPNLLAKQRAHSQGAFEAVMIRDGVVSEATSGNVFLAAGRGLITPIADSRILAGITRDIVIEIARKSRFDVVERDVAADELQSAEEVFITGTTIEVMPVTTIEGVRVGSGVPGTAAREMAELFRAKVRNECQNQAC